MIIQSTVDERNNVPTDTYTSVCNYFFQWSTVNCFKDDVSIMKSLIIVDLIKDEKLRILNSAVTNVCHSINGMTIPIIFDHLLSFSK